MLSPHSKRTSEPCVVIGGTTIPVEVMNTKEEIDRGLSKHSHLEASKGMLFTFDHSAKFKFWMKGMKFPIDMIWIDEHSVVVDITANVPTVGFLQRPVFYSPSVEARYVLEVNAGFAQAHGIAQGTAVSFSM